MIGFRNRISADPRTLAVCRFSFFLSVYLMIGGPTYFYPWANVPIEFWKPSPMFSMLSAPPLSRDVFWWVNILWSWSLAFSAVGLFYRIAAPISFLCGIFLFNYNWSFGLQSHTIVPLILAMFPLAFSRAADVWSFDRLINPKRRIDDDFRVYGLPIWTMKFVFCATFFAAGWSKLRNGGFDWITSDTLRNYLLAANLRLGDAIPFSGALAISRELARQPDVCRILAAGTVLLELSAPLALWNRTLRRMIVPAIFFLQIGIFITVFADFTTYLPIYLIWPNWLRVLAKLRGKIRSLLRSA